MSNDTYLRPQEAADFMQVTTRTLQLWEAAGKISCGRTKGGHRRFSRKELEALRPSPPSPKKRICYCRVSSPSQKEDLQRQVSFLRRKFPDHEIIKDIGSGLNLKRKDLNTILELGIREEIEEVVVTYRDRLCRFGFELLERIVQRGGGKIVVLNRPNTSPQEELVNDLLEIITVFSSRLYGLRSHGIRNTLKRWGAEDPPDEDLPHRPGKGGAAAIDGPVPVVL